MRKTIYSKFDKKAISLLPPVSFSGRIITVLSEQEAEKAVAYLLTSKILGVDTETRPAFHKGETHKVSLLQVANHDTCFLFRLNRIGMCPPIIRLLEDTTVPKIGLSWHDDLLALHRRTAFVPGFFIDLQDIVGLIGIKDLSLQKLYANIFHEKISKRQRLTNWDADVLNDKQQLYASIDAWACVNLYEEISRLMKTKEYDLVEAEEEKTDADRKQSELSTKS